MPFAQVVKAQVMCIFIVWPGSVCRTSGALRPLCPITVPHESVCCVRVVEKRERKGKKRS